MISQQDVDKLQGELERLRHTLVRDRAEVREKTEQVIAKAKRMREEAQGGVYEASINSVCDLLDCLHAGVVAQATLSKCGDQLKQAG